MKFLKIALFCLSLSALASTKHQFIEGLSVFTQNDRNPVPQLIKVEDLEHVDEELTIYISPSLEINGQRLPLSISSALNICSLSGRKMIDVGGEENSTEDIIEVYHNQERSRPVKALARKTRSKTKIQYFACERM